MGWSSFREWLDDAGGASGCFFYLYLFDSKENAVMDRCSVFSLSPSLRFEYDRVTKIEDCYLGEPRFWTEI